MHIYIQPIKIKRISPQKNIKIKKKPLQICLPSLHTIVEFFIVAVGTSKDQLKKSKHILWFFISVFRVNNYTEKINSFVRICVYAAGFPCLVTCLFCHSYGITLSR